MILPEQLIANCRNVPERQKWLLRLPAMLEELTSRWSLRIDAPFDHANVTCSWVAAVLRADGTPAVLKLGMPHMEGADEIHGLRFWNGDPTVQLLEADDERGAMLLERCLPGYMLRSEPEEKQDLLIAALLKRLWRRSTSLNGIHAFRHLSELLNLWRQETLAQAQHWLDAGLVREGLQTFQTLGKPAPTDTLLATDLHAGNVLRSQREPWLVIDPKPFVGDPPYDVVQHLRNCEARLYADPRGMVKRLGELASLHLPNLIAVGAVNQAGDETSFTSYGDTVIVVLWRRAQGANVLDAGLRPTDSSDCTASPADSMMWLQSQLTRTDMMGNVWGANQRITHQQAIFCGTVNGAYAAFRSSSKVEFAQASLLTWLCSPKTLSRRIHPNFGNPKWSGPWWAESGDLSLSPAIPTQRLG